MRMQKNPHNKYKEIIMDRLSTNCYSNTNKKNNSHIYSVKTQCTPNDTTQDASEKIFEDFQAHFKVTYKPIILNQKAKPIGRCLYPELVSIFKKTKGQSKQKAEKYARERFVTESVKVSHFDYKAYMPQKNEPRVAQKSGSKKKMSLTKETKESIFSNIAIKRQASLASLNEKKPAGLKRSQSKRDLKETKTRSIQNPCDNQNRYSAKNIKALVSKMQNLKK